MQGSHPSDFYAKSMASSFCELEGSARAWKCKAATLAMEVYRRLMHTSRDLPIQASHCNLNCFTSKLTISGYSREQARYITLSGLRRYRRMMVEAGEGSMFRSRELMTADREIRKAMQQGTWFHDKDDNDPRDMPTITMHRGVRGHRGVKRKVLSEKQKVYQPVSVIFIPRSDGG